MANYDPKKYDLTVNSVIIEPDGIDNFITYEPSADLVTRTVGSTGEQVHNTNHDTSGTLTIRLLQTSSLNDKFSIFASLDTSFAVLLTDGEGTTNIGSPECKIMRLPNLDIAAEVGNNEWTISMLNVTAIIGGKPGLPAEV